MKLNKRKYVLIAISIILLFIILELVLRPRVLRQSLASSLYQLKQYELAEKILGKAADQGDDLAAANLAKSKYRQQDYAGARAAAEEALEATPEKATRNYDAGNAAYRAQDYEAAAASFRKAMLADPKDLDAKANYELSRKKLQQQSQPKPQPNPQPNEDEQKQEDIRNILGGLDSKESSDRQQKQNNGSAGGDKWW